MLFWPVPVLSRVPQRGLHVVVQQTTNRGHSPNTAVTPLDKLLKCEVLSKDSLKTLRSVNLVPGSLSNLFTGSKIP